MAGVCKQWSSLHWGWDVMYLLLFACWTGVGKDKTTEVQAITDTDVSNDINLQQFGW